MENKESGLVFVLIALGVLFFLGQVLLSVIKT
jgi:hypothetical protein